MDQTNELDEHQLVEAVRAGDASAFVELIRPYDKPLRGLAYAMTGDVSGMDDVLQEATSRHFGR